MSEKTITPAKCAICGRPFSPQEARAGFTTCEHCDRENAPLFSPSRGLHPHAQAMFDVLNRIAEFWAESSSEVPLLPSARLGSRDRSIEGEIWDVLSQAMVAETDGSTDAGVQR